MNKKNVVLTGFMGTGKTVVGKFLAKRLGYKYIDTDEVIEKRVGMKINEIFEKKGEKYFRNIESRVVKDVSKLSGYVIATGGGVVLRSKNMDELEKNGVIINLKASPETIYQRTIKTKGVRPLIDKPNPKKEIVKLLNYRRKFYKRCDFAVFTDRLKLEDVVDKIINFLKSEIQ